MVPVWAPGIIFPFRSGLPRGAWTRKTLLTLFPFGNQAVLRSISGQQLLDALELSVSHAPEENGGFLQVSGLTFVYDPAIPSPVKLDTACSRRKDFSVSKVTVWFKASAIASYSAGFTQVTISKPRM